MSGKNASTAKTAAKTAARAGAKGGSPETEEARLQQLCIEAARSSFLAFLQWCWWMPHELKIGRHTRATCELLTRAAYDWLDGKSTFLIVNMPFRHGKSDMVSRAFPAWFLGFAAERQPDIMMTGYGESLLSRFSKDAKRIIESEEYRAVFPHVKLSDDHNAVNDWAIQDSVGSVTVSGLGGSLTGKGFHLGIVDDYCRSREEAFSETYREKTWHAFAVDFMTRRNAPAAIVIVCATPWHPDDVTGRILKQMKEDPQFPRFRQIKFPAAAPGRYETLFPEMYSPEWYSGQRSTLKSMAAALLDCEPVGEGNRTFKNEWFQTAEKMPPRSLLNVFVIIDSANAKRKKSDYTTMWVIGLGRDKNYYILDCVHERLDLAERTRKLFELVEQWKPSRVFWEQVGCMSDAEHVRLEQTRISWHFVIIAIGQKTAKEDRIGWLVPAFESSRIWFPHRLLRRAANGEIYDVVRDFFDQEYSVYPAAVHDDMLDSLANIFHPQCVPLMPFPVTPGAESYATENARTEAWRPW